MNAELMKKLEVITAEEQKILDGQTQVEKELYSSGRKFTVDSRKMLEKGKLITVRSHTRFVHFPQHTHNFVEIMYMCSGSTEHIVNQTERIILRQGELLFLGRYASHEILPSGKQDIGINFIILPEFFDAAYQMLGGENILAEFILSNLRHDGRGLSYLHFKVADVLPVQNLIENMAYALMTGKQNCKVDEVTMGLLFMILSQYTDKAEAGPGDGSGNQISAAVSRYIDQHYKTASLTELAEELGQSVSGLSRLIRVSTGKTFKELLQEKRFEQALWMLRETDLLVTDIVLAVGYENNSYFHRRFREKFRMSPKEYRKMCQETKAGQLFQK